MSKALQQGQADGMCGLYALLNFLFTTRDWRHEKQGKALWYLLDACRHFGWLTPQHLIEGYEEHQLKAILDLQILNYRMPYKTHFIRETVQASEYDSFYALSQAVNSKQGSLIAHHDEDDHWLLVSNIKGDLSIVDSTDNKRPIRPLTKQHKNLSLQSGLLILPSDAPAVEPII